MVTCRPVRARVIGVTTEWKLGVMLGSMDGEGPVELQVFVQPSCAFSRLAMMIAKEVDRAYPGVDVRVIDLADKPAQRQDVFAIPTYVLNGEVFSLGNPPRDDLRRQIERLLGRRNSV